MRIDHRTFDKLRPVSIKPNFSPYAEGSCFIQFGNTHVLCTASHEETLPPWRRGSGLGWISAEYGMLPRSTHSRMQREAVRGKQNGRTQEIQRLIGRTLRSVVDFQKLGERQIILDCDVIQADGGTRTAAITAGWVALKLAFRKLILKNLIKQDPMLDQLAAVSCGIIDDQCVLDLAYEEDSRAQADANFALTNSGQIVDVQVSGETEPISTEQFIELNRLARKGVEELFIIQNQALNASDSD